MVLKSIADSLIMIRNFESTHPSFRRRPESRLKKMDPGLRRGDGERKIKFHTSFSLGHADTYLFEIIYNIQICYSAEGGFYYCQFDQ